MAGTSWRITGQNADTGKGMTIVVPAPSEDAARAEAAKRGMVGLRISKQSKFSQLANREYFVSLSSKEVAAFARYLAYIADSNTSSIKAIEDYRATTKNRDTATVMADIEKDCRSGGLTLAEALQRQSDRFGGDTLANVYEAGEESGRLKEALGALADSLERSEKLRGAWKKALMSPMIQGATTMLTLVAIALLVIPQMGQILEDVAGEGEELPLATRMITGSSDALIDKWVMFVLLGVLFWAIFKLLRTHDQIGTWWDSMKLKVPVVGELSRRVEMTIACNLIGVLLTSGMPINTVFDLAGRAVGNRRLRKALLSIPERLQVGVDPEIAIAAQCPPLDFEMRRMMNLSMSGVGDPGEPWLNHAAANAEEAENRAHKLTELVQPIFSYGMGALMFLMTAAVMLPIMQINDSIGG